MPNVYHVCDKLRLLYKWACLTGSGIVAVFVWVSPQTGQIANETVKEKNMKKESNVAYRSGVNLTMSCKGHLTEYWVGTQPIKGVTVRGFTLIELLVVVLIIAILAAVALPQYQKAVYRTKYAHLKMLTEELARAEEVYYLANGTYTTNFDSLDITLPEPFRKTGSSSLAKYQYDWGACQLQVISEQAKVDCRNYAINMTYQKYFNHSSSYRKRKICIAWDTTDPTSLTNQICRLETQQSPIYNGSYTVWWY